MTPRLRLYLPARGAAPERGLDLTCGGRRVGLRPVVGPWLLACSLVAGPPSAARAAPPTPPTESPPAAAEVVLIRISPHDAGLAARLRAELDTDGLEIEILDYPETEPMLGPALLDELERGGADAAIELSIQDDRVEVWVADATTQTALTRRFVLEPNDDRARTLAVAAVELLRASRLVADPTLGQRDPLIDQATEHERPPALTLDPVASLSLSALVGGSPGGLGMTTHLEVASRWAATRQFTLSVGLWLPVGANQSVGSQGLSARSFTSMVFVEPQWTPRLQRAQWFRPALGLGLGAAMLISIGQVELDQVEGPADPKVDVVGGFAADAHLELGFVVHPRLRIRVGGHLGLIQPAFRVMLADTAVATYGLPFAMGSLGLEIWI